MVFHSPAVGYQDVVFTETNVCVHACVALQTANTLNLVMRDEGTMKFVKYVSHAAPSSRWDVAAVYEVDQDDTDSDEDDSEDGQ